MRFRLATCVVSHLIHKCKFAKGAQKKLISSLMGRTDRLVSTQTNSSQVGSFVSEEKALEAARSIN